MNAPVGISQFRVLASFYFLCLGRSPFSRIIFQKFFLFFLPSFFYPLPCASITVWSRYSYYTAGSGGAGPTILATSYLLLGEEVEAYQKGILTILLETVGNIGARWILCFSNVFTAMMCRTGCCIGLEKTIRSLPFGCLILATHLTGEIVRLKSYSGERLVDFGKGVGKKPVFLL